MKKAEIAGTHRIRLNNYAFIDGQNLYMSIKQQGWVIDYGRFRRYLADKYGIVKAFLFIGHVPTNADLYKSLQECGFILIFKPILEVKGRVKGMLMLSWFCRQ